MYYFDDTTQTHAISIINDTQIPNCWSSGNTNPNAESTYVPHIVSSDGTTHGAVSYSGKNALYLCSTYGSPLAYAVLPLISTSSRPIALHFKVRAVSHDTITRQLHQPYDQRLSAHTIKVGLMEHPTAPDTMHELMAYQIQTHDTESQIDTADSHMLWEDVQIPLSADLLQTHRYPALVADLPGGYAYNCAYIDDVSIEYAPDNGLYKPYNLKTDSIGTHTITAHWQETGHATLWETSVTPHHMLPNSGVITMQAEQKAVFSDLAPSTAYDLYVRAVSKTDHSEWYGPLSVVTACLYQPTDTIRFDDKSQHEVHATLGRDTFYMQQCWKSFNPTTTSPAYCPYLVHNRHDASYAYSGTSALKLYTTQNYPGATAVMPETEGDMDTLVLHLKARAGYYAPETRQYISYATEAYEHQLLIGTLQDLNDPESFQLIHRLTLDKAPTIQTDNPQHGWTEAAIPLKGSKGRYIALRAGSVMTDHIYVDDISLQAITDTCYIPTQVSVNMQTLTAYHADFTWSSDASQWEVCLIHLGDTIMRDITEVPRYAYEHLTQLEHYIFAVRAICDEERTPWSEVSFDTPCPIYDFQTAYWNFNERLFKYGASSAYLIPECWHVGNPYSTLQYYSPYIAQNNERLTVARDDAPQGQALLFYNLNNVESAYAVMPDIRVALDSAVLHFYGRAAIFHSAHDTESPGRLHEPNSGYSRTLIIGTMSDPNDFSTFTPHNTIHYDYTWAQHQYTYVNSDMTGNNYWQEYYIPLSNYKEGNIAFVQPGRSKSYFYLDDVSILHTGYCSMPYIASDSLTATTASIVWRIPTGEDESYVQVATDELFRNIVYSDTLHAVNQAGIQHLHPYTTYYYRVGHVCRQSRQVEWAVGTFTTAVQPRYAETFGSMTDWPEGWNVGSATAQSLFNGGHLLVLDRGNWSVGTQGADTHLIGTIQRNNYDYYRHIAISPVIDLEQDDTASYLLTFDMAITDQSGSYATTDNPTDEFMVIITDADAQNWREQDATIWNNTGTGNHRFADIGITYKKYHVDLSRYAGKKIRIAFYLRPGDRNTSHLYDYLHIDNIQVNYADHQDWTDTICALTDYADHGFDLKAEQLHVGHNRSERITVSDMDGIPDLVEQISLFVKPAPSTTRLATICAGETYIDQDFNITATASGVYKRKVEGASTCDSVIILSLSVLPSATETQHIDICYGQSVYWHGREVYNTTILTDTLTTSLGCDSILTTYVHRLDALSSIDSITLCAGQVMPFFNQVINSPGTYHAATTSSMGCDSSVTWVVTYLQDAVHTYHAAICRGNTYTDEHFVGVGRSGSYSVHLHSDVTGCDSTLTLHLMVADEHNHVFDTITTDQLPYILNGHLLLETVSSQDDYELPMMTDCGNIMVHIHIRSTSAKTSKVSLSETHLYPNPVQIGQPVMLHSERPISHIRVYDAMGRIVRSLSIDAQPARIPPFEQSGVYIIEATDFGQDICRQKLIVN
ncbi:MAG: hypothetical protein IJ680_06850 [Paludibacteraceae bacterium]|nr:hypothetical protein [Paludibacteraceae bacterium]